MLEIKNISIDYPMKKDIISVINDLTLTICHGEAVAILGPSGCGKSTLINTLAGSVTIKEGRIEYEKENKKQLLNSKVHKIGLIPQNCGLLPWKSIEKNCMLPLKIRKETCDRNRKERITQIYEALGISHLLKKYPRQISGGQLQRAAVARAFIMEPDLLLMDEPFSALDEINREEARKLFLDVWKENRPTTILVTHSIEEALYLGNRVIVMGAKNGKVVYEYNNPFFGLLNPGSLDYLEVKESLRQRLIPEERLDTKDLYQKKKDRKEEED